MGTKFAAVYSRFLGKITDDMYLELTPQDTVKDLKQLLINAIPGFEFPRVDLYNYTLSTSIVEKPEEDDIIIQYTDDKQVVIDSSSFGIELSEEEINILAIMMMEGWLQRQITSIENTRMKYSGTDFKFTSQANHLSKLMTLLTEVQRQSFHLQRLYKRRKRAADGTYQSNWSVLREISAID